MPTQAKDGSGNGMTTKILWAIIAALWAVVLVGGGAYTTRADTRLAAVESRQQDAGERLARVETLLQQIDGKLDKLVH